MDSIELDKIKALYGQGIHSIDDSEKNKKLTNSIHEIVFTITAKVMEENLKGEIVGEKEISVKNYHIPVPIDKDYKNYMSTFFKYLEDKIIDGIDHANENSKEKII